MEEERTLTAADVEKYYGDRSLKWPNITQALLWAMSELGETAEAALQLESSDWIRNNPEKNEKSWDAEELGEELGDIILMCVVAGLSAGVDPIRLMRRKMKRKVDDHVKK